jgi:hypothetical protein
MLHHFWYTIRYFHGSSTNVINLTTDTTINKGIIIVLDDGVIVSNDRGNSMKANRTT